jgi:signal transduction histidine kinase
MLIFFFNGLAFGGLGMAGFLQLRQGSDLPLGRHLKWLAAFGFTCALTNWIDMFLASGSTDEYIHLLTLLRMIAQPLTGLFLLKFGWGLLKEIPLPAWTVFIPGVLIVPLAYVITYATTTFITPSPIEIPIDIWSRYLLYLPGSILAGIGFMRQWRIQCENGVAEVANLMLGAGLAFLVEAFIVGLVVPAAPYGPNSYYNYDRVIFNAFSGESPNLFMFSGFTNWLDYQRVLDITGLPIQFWRMLSSFAVTFFVIRGLGVFEARRRIQLNSLRAERDRAQVAAFDAQVSARQTAERWTEVLYSINRKIIELDDPDETLLFIVDNARELLDTDFVGLALINDDHSKLELKCYSANGKTQTIDTSMVVNSPLILNTIKTGRSILSSGVNIKIPLEQIIYFPEMDASDAGIVSLAMDGHQVGALWAARSTNKPYTETDLVWLECMADQVIIAIQHALMTSKMQSISISEERARIAREMHDGLAQILGYMNLQVQTLDALHKQGKIDEVAVELGNMRKAVKAANADVRENILSLRTTLADGKSLVSAIGEYLEEFEIQTGIETRFLNEIENDLNLSSIAEVQLVCILQEALANVRKHAHANQVSVLVTKQGQQNSESIYVQIVDDGIGISEHDSKFHYGLKTMEDRAVSVDGRFEVQSEDGKGTTISCWLPRLEQGKMKKNKATLSKGITIAAN